MLILKAIAFIAREIECTESDHVAISWPCLIARTYISRRQRRSGVQFSSSLFARNGGESSCLISIFITKSLWGGKSLRDFFIFDYNGGPLARLLKAKCNKSVLFSSKKGAPRDQGEGGGGGRDVCRKHWERHVLLMILKIITDNDDRYVNIIIIWWIMSFAPLVRNVGMCLCILRFRLLILFPTLITSDNW